MSQQLKEELVIIGRFGRPIGIKGQIKFYVYSREPETVAQYQPWKIKTTANNWEIIKPISITLKDKFLVVLLDGISDRNAAEKLTNMEVVVTRSQLPMLSEGEYYWQDLIGLKVINHNQKPLGKVIQLLETGANDVLVVEADDNKHLIPFILEQYILNIDLKSGEIMVHWDEDY